MNLDDHQTFPTFDPANILARIDGLPGQLESAWKLGQELPLPAWQDIRQVVISGMGGSAIGADLLAAYLAPTSHVPVFVHRDYDLPAFAHGPETLVIATSHSGNTEETLSSFERASENGCRCIALTTGGKLAQMAQQAGVPCWIFDHNGPPRTAVGYSFGLLLSAVTRLSLLSDPSDELSGAVAAMRKQQERLRADVPAVQNPAKRYAGQFMGRWVVVIGAEILAPVARRWKGQINEIAKAWSQLEMLPEADHNTLEGLLNPEDLMDHMLVLFLQAPSYHPRNQLRSELTRQSFMMQGINTDVVNAQGNTRLDHLWTALHFGDYTAYYLAMAYGVDPTPVEMMDSLKQTMKAQ